MNAASLKDIKTELEHLQPSALLHLTLRLAKFKKENKELLTYLLFHTHNEQGYVEEVQNKLQPLFSEVNIKNYYLAKKTIRKIIGQANRFIKYSDSISSAADILIFICENLKKLPINIKNNTGLHNLYLAQIKKIKKAINSLHEDMQYDYSKQVEGLETL